MCQIWPDVLDIQKHISIFSRLLRQSARVIMRILMLAAAVRSHIRNDSLVLGARLLCFSAVGQCPCRHIFLQIAWRDRDYLCVWTLRSRHYATFRRVGWMLTMQGRRVPGFERQHLLQTVWNGRIPRSNRCLVLEFVRRRLKISGSQIPLFQIGSSWKGEHGWAWCISWCFLLTSHWQRMRIATQHDPTNYAEYLEWPPCVAFLRQHGSPPPSQSVWAEIMIRNVFCWRVRLDTKCTCIILLARVLYDMTSNRRTTMFNWGFF